MNGILNFFKGLFSSIFGIFSNKSADETAALPKPRKRSSGYFLELDDDTPSSTPALSAAPKAVEKAPEPQPVAVATATAEPAAKPSSRKAKLAALAAANGEVSKEVGKAAASTTTPTKPETANQALNLPQPTVTTFAPDYLMPKATSTRRRPGANMNSYLTMARQVKTPG